MMKHVHADLIKLYAKQLIAWADASADIEKHPARDWELLNYSKRWERMHETFPPNFTADCQYRYNPRPKTVARYLCDGTPVELPEPCRVIETREKYWVVRADGTVMENHYRTFVDSHFLLSGNCYRTESDAITWARYLKHIRTGEPVEKAND